MRRKNLLIIGMSIALLFSGCGKEAEVPLNEQRTEESGIMEESFEMEEEVIIEEKPQFENGLIFSTEYEIEDYCGGYFIVSKNDGLLYGVLDMNGEEWIPCEYDEVCFLNKNEFVDGKDDTLLIKLRYENMYTVMNQSGELVLDNVDGLTLQYADYEIGKITENSAAIALSYTLSDQKKGIRLYNKTGDVLLEVELEGVTGFGFETMISDGFFLAGSSLNNDHHKTYLYSMNGDIVNQWEGWALIGARGFGTYYDDKAEIIMKYGNYHFWTIDSSGRTEFVGEYTNNDYESMIKQEILSNMEHSRNLNDYSNEFFKLYKSNDTWKFEDFNGTPIYEKRYYECKTYRKYDGTVIDMVLLSNENGEAIVINRFGQKVIDYGWLTIADEGGYTEVYFNGSPFDSAECYVEDSGICYIQGNDVYYFQPIV